MNGECRFLRKAPLQVAATLGFCINRRAGTFPGLSPEEVEALKECVLWARDGNNHVFELFGTTMELFHEACGKLLSTLAPMPLGAPRARIRLSHRDCRNPVDGQLGDTMTTEQVGLVVVDNLSLIHI